MEVNSVSFGAAPINRIKVQKLNKNKKKFEDYFVNFVRLEPYNKKDLEALEFLTQKWKDAKYVQQISTAAHWMKEKSINVYALTNQKRNFEKLQADKILGHAEMRKDEHDPENIILYHLQARPSAMNVNKTGRVNYKHVGSSILSSLKKIYDDISLFSDKDDNIENFYRRNGFIDAFKGSRHFVWNKNPFKRLIYKIEKFRLETGI